MPALADVSWYVINNYGMYDYFNIDESLTFR